MSENESAYHLSRDDIRKVISVAGSLRDRIIIKILAQTGMRRAELRNIEVTDIDFYKRRIYIRNGKGNKSRTVPVDQDTLQDVRFYLGERKEGKLIQSNKAESISLKQINEVCIKAGKVAGVRHPNPRKNNLNPHLFRHSFARMALEKGMRMEIVQNILGHSSIKTTIDVYGTPGMESVQSSYDRIMGSP